MTIQAMNYDGGEQRIVTDFGAKPVWSADGTRIAFHDDAALEREIRVINVYGGHPINLTDNPLDDKTPGWSNNGQRIAFCRDRKYRSSLMVMNADGTGQIALTNGGGCGGPAWSPNDQEIVFASIGPNPDDAVQIWRIAADGTGLTRLSNVESGCGGPDYLPDGTAIIFHCPQVGKSRAWIMDADGGNQRRFDPIPWTGVAHLHWWEK
jgi:TolB protein